MRPSQPGADGSAAVVVGSAVAGAGAGTIAVGVVVEQAARPQTPASRAVPRAVVRGAPEGVTLRGRICISRRTLALRPGRNEAHWRPLAGGRWLAPACAGMQAPASAP
jgi:hypothetical protein